MPKVILKPKANFDLLPKNPRPGLLKLENTKVKVEIEIETKAPNSAKTDRWTQVAEDEMARYREIVQDTVDKVTAKWEQGKEIKPLSERQKDVKALSTSIGGAYCSTQQRRWDEEMKAKDWKAKTKLLAKEIWTSQKSLANKCEDARKKYRNEVTVMIEKVDKVGDKRDALQKALEKSGDINAKSLANGALKTKLGASIKTMDTRILECQGFVDDMAFLLTENGVDVDDSTAMEKLKKLKNLGSIAEAGAAIHKAAKDVQDIVEAFAS